MPFSTTAEYKDWECRDCKNKEAVFPKEVASRTSPRCSNCGGILDPSKKFINMAEKIKNNRDSKSKNKNKFVYNKNYID
jgi:ribosomal protein S27E